MKIKTKNKQKQKRGLVIKQWDENKSLSILYTQTKSVAFSLLGGRRWGKHTKAMQLFCSGTTTECRGSIKGFPLSKLGLPQRKNAICGWIPVHGLYVLSWDTRGKRCLPVSVFDLQYISPLITLKCRGHYRYTKWQFQIFFLKFFWTQKLFPHEKIWHLKCLNHL